MTVTPARTAPPWSATPEEVSTFLREAANDDRGADVDPGPFFADVKAGKNSAVYNAHAYRTKVPPDGIMPYLEHYTRPGDVVLDPFCGSGMTGVACLMTGRRAVLNDLSPAATHIAAGYTQQVDLVRLQGAWRRVEAAIAPLCDELYVTVCERCGGRATIQYTVWSDTYGCRNCGAEIVLWDAAVVRSLKDERYQPPLSASAARAEDWTPPSPEGSGKPAGAVLEQFACPACRREWAKTALERQRTVPVLIDYECNGACRPKRSSHPPSTADLALIEDVAARSVPHWVPETPFDEDREMWRGAHRDAGITRARDFWTARNLLVLAAAWDAIGFEPEAGGVREALRFAFTASALLVSRMRRFRTGGSGIVTGTLYIPSLTLEVHVLQLLRKKVGDFTKARQSMAAAPNRQQAGSAGRVLVETGSATQLDGVPDGSIDYVFTDPPFGANIFYADCSFPWEAWLGWFGNDAQEAVWNKSRKPEQGGKTLDGYARLMEASFREIRRVLKPGRWASVVFHNSDDRVWDAIRDGARAAGLDLANAVALDKEQRSFKGIKGEKGEERVTNFDIVLNLRRLDEAATAVGTDARGAARPVVSGEPVREAASPAADETDARIAAIVAAHLEAVAAGAGAPAAAEAPDERLRARTPAADRRSTQFLHSLVIRRLLSDDLPVTDASYARVEAVVQAYFKQVDGHWYGRGEEVQAQQGVLAGHGMVEVRDEASAISWARELIRSRGPQPWGDLINALQRAAPRLRTGPEELLRQNFVLDPRRSRWRLPTAVELQELGDVQRRLLKERAERWVAGSGRGPLDGTTKADWFERLFGHEEYLLALEVFRRTFADEVDAETWRRMSRRASLCEIKTGVSATIAKREEA